MMQCAQIDNSPEFSRVAMISSIQKIIFRAQRHVDARYFPCATSRLFFPYSLSISALLTAFNIASVIDKGDFRLNLKAVHARRERIKDSTVIRGHHCTPRCIGFQNADGLPFIRVVSRKTEQMRLAKQLFLEFSCTTPRTLIATPLCLFARLA